MLRYTIITVLFAVSLFSIFEVVQAIRQRDGGRFWQSLGFCFAYPALLAGIVLPPTPGHPKFFGLRIDCFHLAVWSLCVPGLYTLAQQWSQRLAQRLRGRRKGAI